MFSLAGLMSWCSIWLGWWVDDLPSWAGQLMFCLTGLMRWCSALLGWWVDVLSGWAGGLMFCLVGLIVSWILKICLQQQCYSTDGDSSWDSGRGQRGSHVATEKRLAWICGFTLQFETETGALMYYIVVRLCNQILYGQLVEMIIAWAPMSTQAMG